MDISTLLLKLTKTEKKYPGSVFQDKNKSYTFINPYSYHLYRQNKELFDKVDGCFVDGILMCLTINFLYKTSITRRSFDWTAVAKDLFNRCNKTNESVFLVGAKKNEITETIRKLKDNFPAMNIVGFRDGYFSTAHDKRQCINYIISLKPNFVIVGMGAVLQEEFIISLHEDGYSGISFTCGGYIHQASISLNYYPNWINKYNLRAFYRLYKERGMLKRLYNVLIQFPFLFISDYLNNTRNNFSNFSEDN